MNETHHFTLQTRHINVCGKRTTIALEAAYWRQIDSKAASVGLSWQRWLDNSLADRPACVGKARWLRVQMLSKPESVINGFAGRGTTTLLATTN